MAKAAAPIDQNARIRATAMQAGALMGGILAAGTLGYRLLEGWSWLDSMYMTVITLATVGFGETHQLSPGGRVFTMVLILLGVGALGFALAEATAFLAGGGLLAYRRRERMDKMTRNLRHHTIICGCGRLGSAVAEQLHASGSPFLVIDRDPRAIDKLHLGQEVPFLPGDANDDDILRRAGIDHASALVAALNDDAHNVFLTLTARVLTRDSNPRLIIHGKADDPATLLKLARAGATHAFSPSHVLGHRIANQIIRPALTDLVELTTRKGDVELTIEEVSVDAIAATGKRLQDAAVWGKAGMLVLAVRKSTGSLVFPPKPADPLGSGDHILVMGKSETLDALSASEPR